MSPPPSPPLSPPLNPLSSLLTNEDLIPIRPPTTPETEIVIPIPGLFGPLDADIAEEKDRGQGGVEGSGNGEGKKGVRLKVDAGPGCGGIAWPAGEVLSRYLSYRQSQSLSQTSTSTSTSSSSSSTSYLANKTILELGSGTGLVGIVAGMLEPRARVWVTDIEALLPLMRENVNLNFPSPPPEESSRTSTPTTNQPSEPSSSASNSQSYPNVKVSHLDWSLPLPLPSLSSSTPSHPNTPHSTSPWDPLPSLQEIDLILAADCVYFEPAFEWLVETLCGLVPLPSGSLGEGSVGAVGKRKKERKERKRVGEEGEGEGVDGDAVGEDRQNGHRNDESRNRNGDGDGDEAEGHVDRAVLSNGNGNTHNADEPGAASNGDQQETSVVDKAIRKSPEVLFCWKKRRKADMRFFKLLHKHFQSFPVEDDRPGERERYEREGVKLMRLVRVK